uniref:S8 family serine peptidase n=1 Tax=Lachnoclostridium phocaeense TaxID=1871021 RepID=UPI0026DD7A33|nr:S8 family serine peptidase [Lachnoclostridium phocaeense]
MTTIAIIDDGIDSAFLPSKIIVEHINFSYSKKAPRNTHGSLCAQIIHKIESKVKFVSINVIEDDHKGNINSLIKALDWCLFHDIDIINMSLGTLNYHEGLTLLKPINKLIKKGVLIVAAYHNSNIVTFPATLPGVFGVRQDRNNFLNEYEHTFTDEKNLNIENTIIAHFDGNEKQSDVYYTITNSLAAPVITGKLAAQKIQNTVFTYEEAKDYLLATQCSYAGRFQVNQIRKYFDVPSLSKLEIPLIYISYELTNDVTRFLQKNDYHFEILMWKAESGNILPLEYYWPCRSLDQFLFTIDAIYQTDLYIISGQIPNEFPSEMFHLKMVKTKTGILIKKDNKEYFFSEINKSLYSLLVLLEGNTGGGNYE